MEKNIYRGLITALITPFKQGKIDLSSLNNLIELQIKVGVNGLVIGGTTGEGSSLEDQDYYDLIISVRNIANKRIPIIAGLACSSSEYAVNKIKKLTALNIDGIMCTVPYYVRPEQEGLIGHFKMLHDNSNLPIIIYIHPGRTGIDLTDESILRLAEYPRIVAVKDSGNDIERPLRLTGKLPLNFNMLTGNENNTIAYNSHGGRGCISVASNILPEECLKLQIYLKNGNYPEAIILQQKLLPFYEAIFGESNPIGIKYAASLLNLCSEEIKMPLTIANNDTKFLLKKVLKDFGKI